MSSNKHRTAETARLVRAAFTTTLCDTGATVPAARIAVAARAAALVLEMEPPHDPWIGEDVAALANTMVEAPVLADLGRLIDNGHTEDEVFELTVACAIGIGRARLERGMAAIDATRPAQRGAA